MPRSESKNPLLPSLLDRLIDEAPENARETWSSGYHSFAELRAAIQRDLQNLLNTRRRLLDWPDDDAGPLPGSVIAYGVPDITGRHLGSPAARTAFLRSVEELIRRFEPRFKRVKVSARSAPGMLDRTLHFAIEAEVFAEPVPEPVAFDTTVEPVTRSLKVDLAAAR